MTWVIMRCQGRIVIKLTTVAFDASMYSFVSRRASSPAPYKKCGSARMKHDSEQKRTPQAINRGLEQDFGMKIPEFNAKYLTDYAVHRNKPTRRTEEFAKLRCRLE